ncbi:hypothetical protein L9F63_010998 [Diploptera punctata]|uniref:NADP-dependent oxidoreductase domain-containing protein n=1 Tax=Diploptera punctata TaxID=6984 RepID=A0AAD8AGG0_DIPPU|nr:hypothetical protein L9F63_010998 [Diploptera punctata]
MAVPTVKLNNGCDFPALGCGTYKKVLLHNSMEDMVKNAIDIGYRHIDAAMFYQNEDAVGRAIKEKVNQGVIERGDLFITSKLWNNYHRPDLVIQMCKKSVSDLGLDYLDLYLIHWPFAVKEGDDFNPVDEEGYIIPSDVDYLDTWKAMEECVEKRLARSIGVSNFNSEQVQRVLDHCTIKPVVNQIECHPYLNQLKLIDFCMKRNVVVTAHSPLGGAPRPTSPPGTPMPINDPNIKEIADRREKSVAQVIIRWLIQHGVVPIPKSSNRKRLEENFNVFGFQLSCEEMDSIDALNKNIRIAYFPKAIKHKDYPFHIEF